MIRSIRLAALGTLLAALAACPGKTTPAGPDASGSCATLLCGKTCCGKDQVCDHQNACCTPTSCAGRDCGDDGCGTECGICGTGTICDSSSKCVACTPETNAQFCARLGKQCGANTGKDNCNADRTVADCGTCTNGKGCAADGTCTGPCTPQTADEFCAAHGKNCGPYAATDNCLASRTENCGTCPNGGACTDNTCPCQYGGHDAFCATMAIAGKECGVIVDKNNCGTDQTEDCGTLACTSVGKVCNAATNQCVACTGEADADLCLAKGKECGTFATTDKCGAARNPVCPACTGQKTCANNVCKVSGGPANDACDAPEVLVFSGDTAQTHDDTSGANPDYTGGCSAGSASGADLVYSFVIGGSVARKVSVTATADTGSNLSPVVYVRETCALAASEKGCGTGTTTATATLSSAAPGTWYVIVDGATTDAGGFTLTVTLSTAVTPPPNDTCASAQDLGDYSTSTAWTHDATADTWTQQVAGTTNGANDDAGTGTCATTVAPQDGGDVFYKLTIPTGQERSADIFVTSGSGSYFPAAYVRSDCTSTNPTAELGCSGMQTGGGAHLTVNKLTAGDYWIIVNGESGSQGDFQLSVTLGAPIIVPDDCTSPQLLVFAGNVATASGDTAAGMDDTQSANCGDTHGPDLVYQLDLQAAHDVQIDLAPTAGSQLMAVLSLRSDCANIATERKCRYAADIGDPVSLKVTNLAPGTYFIWVDTSFDASYAGPFDFAVTLSPPTPAPPNDTCGTPPGSAAVALNFNGTDTATQAGDSTGAADDYQGSCSAYGQVHDGGDVVYSFVVPSGPHRSITATVTPDATATGYAPAVYLWQACDPTSSNELACSNAADVGQNATALVLDVAPGTYYAIVDGQNSSSGKFTLTVTLAAPIILPDTCATAQTINLDTSGHGSASGDNTLSTGLSEGSCEWGGEPVLIYSVLTTGRGVQNLAATVTFGSSAYGAGVYIRSDCATASSELACQSSSNNIAAARAKSLPEGRYFIFVDCDSSTAGPFTLAVTASTPNPPANDTCAGTIPFLALNGGTATVNPDTSEAANDYSPSCALANGGDTVYKLTVPTGPAQMVTATLTADAAATGLTPVVYIRRTCADPGHLDELACAVADSVTATATINSLAPGDYYVWVDGIGDDGASTLTVTLSAAISGGPANWACAFATPVDVSTGTGTASGTTNGGVNETLGTCQDTSENLSPESVFQFTLADHKSATVTVTPGTSSSTFTPVVYLRRACDSGATADELACAVGQATGGPVSVTLVDLGPGTYYVWVDGQDWSATSGDFQLAVQIANPILPPPNDTCGANVVALTLNASPVAGDTTAAIDDYGDTLSTPCGYAVWSEDAVGADAVYSYTPQAPGQFTVIVHPTTSWDPLVWYTTGTCGGTGSTCVDAVDDGGSGGDELLTVANGQVGTTYFIYVDASYIGAGYAGPFTIQVVP